MKAPSIDISFIEKGISAVTRSERGIVMLWVKDALPPFLKNPITVVTESDIPEALQENTVEQVKLAMAGYTNAPKKVLVYCMDILADATETEQQDTETEQQEETPNTVETGYKEAMRVSETIKFDYLAIPTVESDGKASDVAAWIKTMRTERKKKVTAVLPNTPADNEGIINLLPLKWLKQKQLQTRMEQRALKKPHIQRNSTAAGLQG